MKDPDDPGASACGQAEFDDARLLFEQVPVGVFVYDRGLILRDCNEALCTMLQASRERLVGINLRNLRDQRPMPAYLAVLEGRSEWYQGPYRSTVNSIEIWVEVRTTPFQSAGAGGVAGGIAIVRDVTSQVRSQQVHRALWQVSEAAHRVESVRELERSLAQTLTSLASGLTVAVLVDREGDSGAAGVVAMGVTGRLLERVARAGRGIQMALSELALWADGEGLEIEDLRRWSGIPLLEGSRVIGAVGVGWKGESGLWDDRPALDLLAGQIALVVERKRNEVRIEALARHDELTGLPNRRQLQEVTDRLLLGAGFGLLLFADLDRFKRVNDTLGHVAGDELLCLVAKVLAEVAAGLGGICARLGGDEFALFAPHLGRDEVPRVWELVRSGLDRTFLVRGHRVRVSTSVGVVLAPEHGRSLDDLLRGADIALYEAKDAGVGFAIFDPSESGVGERRLELETRLRESIAADELRLVFQPYFSLVDGTMTGAEALVRWPLGGRILSAGEFVPLAEESELIQRLDSWVLGQAIACLNSCPRWLGSLSVNVSPRSLHDPGFASEIQRLLTAHGDLRGRLILEITETAAVRRPASMRRVMEELRTLGARLAIDDFGSGFASLTSLRALPCDVLKLDRSLVADIGVADGAEPILTAALALGHGLGLEVVAEGIETPEQYTWLRAAGFVYGQGWHLGRPTSWAELVRSTGLED